MAMFNASGARKVRSRRRKEASAARMSAAAVSTRRVVRPVDTSKPVNAALAFSDAIAPTRTRRASAEANSAVAKSLTSSAAGRVRNNASGASKPTKTLASK